MSKTVSQRAYYSAPLSEFCRAEPDRIFGEMAKRSDFELQNTQRDAWLEQTGILQAALRGLEGSVYLEFTIPRMGSRVDALVIVGKVLMVIEFKVGESTFHASDVDQVVDYALDLHHFHEGSHNVLIAPILVATKAKARLVAKSEGKLLAVSKTGAGGLQDTLMDIIGASKGDPIDIPSWERSGYRPTPTIIEATLALYRGHSVAEIARHEAGMNLARTAGIVEAIIARTRQKGEKAVCFVTGVPGAGKTLVGLDAATRHSEEDDELRSVFLSGNGPLVQILREALVRDEARRKKIRKGEAFQRVKGLIQNVHHFRDDCLIDREQPPYEHVAIFDEAQRAWNLKQTVDFMRRKKRISSFSQSEPEFLLSCLDRHRDWAVVLCLVGGGQEINTGEAGIREWISAVKRSFPGWTVYVSDRLHDTEYGAEREIAALPHVEVRSDLHLAVSVRSFRSEKVSQLVKEVLDLEVTSARETLRSVDANYPILLTRSLPKAREWLRARSRGSERCGLVVSSQAERLKPHAVDVRSPVNPVHWFLGGKEDVRSSHYLEDVATEFHIQGLELDWAGVVWDADFRYTSAGWSHWSFRGSKWQRIRSAERQGYLKNAYRVLLTRARQGMVIVVPEGDHRDTTRHPSFYDGTYDYLKEAGLAII